MIYLDYAMLAVGIVLLAISLISVRGIIGMLDRSSGLRRKWLALGGFIVFFLITYSAILVLQLGDNPTGLDDVFALILFTGAAFVLIVARLSYVTTNDIIRIAKLERDVLLDPLTGVFNRRYLDAKLGEEVGRAARLNQPLSTVMLDLDHFKHVNDTYGHEAGDLVLRHVSALIQHEVRDNETVARYGGEEFVVLAPGSDIGAAASLGERLRQKIAETNVPLPDGRDLQVTASLGVSSITGRGSAEALLRQADQALYSAKRGGRNRLCTA